MPLPPDPDDPHEPPVRAVLESFTVDRVETLALDPVTINWVVRFVNDEGEEDSRRPGLFLIIDGAERRIPPTGTHVDRPTHPARYQLVAKAPGRSIILGTLRVTPRMEGPLFVRRAVAMNEIRYAVNVQVDHELQHDHRISRRRAERISIEPPGLHLGIFAKLSKAGFEDPDIDMRIVIRLGSSRGVLVTFPERVDVSWDVSILSDLLLFIAPQPGKAIALAFIAEEIEERRAHVRQIIVDRLATGIRDSVTGTIVDLRLGTDEILVTARLPGVP